MCKTMGTLYIILVIFIGLCSGLKNPGLKTRITQKGLSYAINLALQQLSNNIKNQRIPDQNGKNGDVEFWLSDMTVKDFRGPTSSVTVDQGQGLVWRSSGIGLRVDPDFRYKYKNGLFQISDHGSIDLDIRDLSFSISFTIGMDAKGLPDIKSHGCHCHIGSAHVKFHGGAAWIYNIFSGNVENMVKDQFEDKMCDVLRSLINKDAQKNLAKLKVITDVGDSYLLDYSFISPPLYKGNFMETYHKGEIVWKQDKQETPFMAPPMPQFSNSNKMFYIGISDYVFNSFSYSAYKHGILNYYLTQNDLEPDARGFLNATCIGSCIGLMIPQIPKMYPKSSIEISLNASAAPVMSFRNGSLEVLSVGKIDFYCKLPKGEKVFIMTALANMTTTVPVSLQKENIVASVQDLRIKVHLTKSTIGKVKNFALQFLVNRIIAGFLRPTLNEVGRKGIPLPVNDHVHFVNTQLILKQDALMIATDLKYD